MRIAVIGATGNIGAKIVQEAVHRGHQVTGIARDVSKLHTDDNVTPAECDVADQDKLAGILKGHDAVVISVKHNSCNVDQVYDACRQAGVKRVLIVGGAASLEVEPGVRLLDTPGFPEEIKPEAAPAVEALDRIRQVEDLDWSFVCPSIIIAPGERTGKFRLGADELLTDDNGDSRISQEDFAVAILDEVENPQHIRQRFTVGY
jgi:putative NADH-flavin reductase